MILFNKGITKTDTDQAAGMHLCCSQGPKDRFSRNEAHIIFFQNLHCIILRIKQTGRLYRLSAQILHNFKQDHLLWRCCLTKPKETTNISKGVSSFLYKKSPF